MKRRILLVDDEIAILLTLKAVLEISGFEVETAASAKEAKVKLKKSKYAMVITDMRMEREEAGREVIRAARAAEYHPAVALLTAFPVAEEDWQEMGADNMLVKPMQIQVLLQRIEALLTDHTVKRTGLADGKQGEPTTSAALRAETISAAPAKRADKGAPAAGKSVRKKMAKRVSS